MSPVRKQVPYGSTVLRCPRQYPYRFSAGFLTFPSRDTHLRKFHWCPTVSIAKSPSTPIIDFPTSEVWTSTIGWMTILWGNLQNLHRVLLSTSPPPGCGLRPSARWRSYFVTTPYFFREECECIPFNQPCFIPPIPDRLGYPSIFFQGDTPSSSLLRFCSAWPFVSISVSLHPLVWTVV